ncbi:hypothetical protein T265_06494 [Opisthorchis viverrini]|uniref:Uncharacterized protein n=1 Tax=Opisthorchis viverrini TaxID=6198 RepID=A0A075ADR6_OPIVI|nr:hypothetical protein T265_06494 [Opisthorchis viverrini]KER26214.1 hypothetical protein T265_06494 [Opisthorchis viverrini]
MVSDVPANIKTKNNRHQLQVDADRKVCISKPTPAYRLALSRLRRPDSISALVLPYDSTAARHRKRITAELLLLNITPYVIVLSYTVHLSVASTQHRDGQKELCETNSLLACEVHVLLSVIYEA